MLDGASFESAGLPATSPQTTSAVVVMTDGAFRRGRADVASGGWCVRTITPKCTQLARVNGRRFPTDGHVSSLSIEAETLNAALIDIINSGWI